MRALNLDYISYIFRYTTSITMIHYTLYTHHIWLGGPTKRWTNGVVPQTLKKSYAPIFPPLQVSDPASLLAMYLLLAILWHNLYLTILWICISAFFLVFTTLPAAHHDGWRHGAPGFLSARCPAKALMSSVRMPSLSCQFACIQHNKALDLVLNTIIPQLGLACAEGFTR